jgi:hypothetical protein
MWRHPLGVRLQTAGILVARRYVLPELQSSVSATGLEMSVANMFHTDPNTVERVALLRVRR